MLPVKHMYVKYTSLERFFFTLFNLLEQQLAGTYRMLCSVLVSALLETLCFMYEHKEFTERKRTFTVSCISDSL